MDCTDIDKMIFEIIPENNLDDIKQVLQRSFITVAAEFDITKENAPTNPAFTTCEMIKKSIEKGLKLYGLYVDGKAIGTVGIEDANRDDLFFIERLAVVPECRHKGYGKILLDYAITAIKKENGKKVSIGIIDKNIRLKNWYQNYGFVEKEVKTYDHLPFGVCFMEMTVQ